MDKWSWMMNYCKERLWPPAQKWAWDRADEAWNQRIKESDDGHNG